MPMLVLLAAAAAAPLQPLGRWTVSYSENDCTMERSFGAADRPTTFGFKPEPTRDAGEMVLILPDKGKGRVTSGRGFAAVNAGTEQFPVRWVTAPLADGRHGIRMNTGKAFWTAFPSARTITFDVGEPQPVSATLGATGAGLLAIKACGDDLLRHWGADPAAMVLEVDEGQMTRAFGPDAYPVDALRMGKQGRTRTVTDVDRDGRPVRCRVVDGSGTPSLDEATCSIIMRKISLAGAPMGPERRFLYLAVRWLLP